MQQTPYAFIRRYTNYKSGKAPYLFRTTSVLVGQGYYTSERMIRIMESSPTTVVISQQNSILWHYLRPYEVYTELRISDSDLGDNYKKNVVKSTPWKVYELQCY